MMGAIQCTDGVAVQANAKSPIGMSTPPKAHMGNLASGGNLPPACSSFTL